MTQPPRYMNQWQICIGPFGLQHKIRLMMLSKNGVIQYETAMNRFHYTDGSWDT